MNLHINLWVMHTMVTKGGVVMTAEELFCKDIIQLGAGIKLGRADDVWLDPQARRLEGLILRDRPRWLRWLGKGQELRIPWEQVVSIGQDVILVELKEQEALQCEQKGLFSGMFAKAPLAPTEKTGI